MKLSAGILSTILLVSGALAAPLTEMRRARYEARRLAHAEERAVDRQSNPPFNPGTTEIINRKNITEVSYSSNWAGAVLVGTGYTAVTGEFTVPTPSVPSGGSASTQYCGSAWVGIDGDTCDSAILQTGVDWCILEGDISYSAWYEWYPAAQSDWSGITISAGDVISVTVDATSTSGGTAILENLSTGIGVETIYSGQTDELCEYNAEWIVEDFSSGGLVPFADFGTVTFTGCEATDDGTVDGPADATIIDIYQDEVLTSVSISGTDVVIEYI